METRLGFEDILRRYEKEIYCFVRRMTGDSDDAADILQETFLRAFKAFPKLPADSNHRAWLYRVSGRLALNLARSRKVRNAVPVEQALHLPEKNGDLESLVETRRLARALSRAVRALSTRQRVALLQRKFEGLSYTEIASTLGCSEQSARAHVYQAMEKIRHKLVPNHACDQEEKPRTRRSS